MTYSTSSPPRLMIQNIGGVVPNLWTYSSSDASATVDGASYITNGGALGMKVGDIVLVNDTANKIQTMHYVITVSATAPGAVDLSNGTTVGTATNSD